MSDETAGAWKSAVSSHVDQRTLRQKLTDLAEHPRTPPEEADAARRALAALPAPKTLGRADILEAPDLRASVGSRTVWSPHLRAHVLVDLDDPTYADLFDDNVEDWDGRD